MGVMSLTVDSCCCWVLRPHLSTDENREDGEDRRTGGRKDRTGGEPVVAVVNVGGRLQCWPFHLYWPTGRQMTR